MNVWRRLVVAAGSIAIFAMPTAVIADTVPMAGIASKLDTSIFAAVRAADVRLATIGYRLAIANAALCRSLQPGTGLQLHALAQYAPGSRTTAQRYFGFAGPIAVEGVVAGSPAASAGVQPGDTITGVNGIVIDPGLPDAAAAATTAPLDAIDRQLAALPPAMPIRLIMIRSGKQATVTITPVPACRTRFELLLNDRFDAQADGELVQIGSKFLDSYSDDQVAVIVGHELSHNILRHRVRLEAAKVSFGLLAEVGKNGRLFRRTETEADQLGVVLIANAGYDPAVATRFWRGSGAKIDGGLFRARTHAGAASRAKITGDVAAGITPATPRPIMPPLLATRDQSLE